ncbi:Uncharacterized protein NEOC65_001556 [Neochlamydia sp. AcF65]|nr:Uncharacterized protein [Neochlamydia sp. AcF65]
MIFVIPLISGDCTRKSEESIKADAKSLGKRGEHKTPTRYSSS